MVWPRQSCLCQQPRTAENSLSAVLLYLHRPGRPCVFWFLGHVSDMHKLTNLFDFVIKRAQPNSTTSKVVLPLGRGGGSA